MPPELGSLEPAKGPRFRVLRFRAEGLGFRV